MKADLYVVKRSGRWAVHMTIAPEIDYWHWFVHNGSAEEGWLWKESLPLGWACRAVELWKARHGAEEDGEAALAGLAILVEELKAEDEEHGGRARRSETVSFNGWLGKKKSGLARGREELWQLAKRWTYGQEAQSLAQPEGARFEVAAAMAKLAAGLLQGRALLGGEARALLEGAVPGAAASWSEAIQLAALLGHVRLGGSVAVPYGRADAVRRSRCLRCGSGETRLCRTGCASCGRVCAYCEACLSMGRSRECELLVLGSGGGFAPVVGAGGGRPSAGEASQPMDGNGLAKWGLSPAQRAATLDALRFVDEGYWKDGLGKGRSNGNEVSPLRKKGRWTSRLGFTFITRGTANKPSLLKNKIRTSATSPLVDEWSQVGKERVDIRHFLFWAVTGAGKTEMIFPLVDLVLSRGGRVLIASPRRDVVLELDPRIRRAFPDASVVTLYGGSEQRWERGHITLSTTHQLFRFHEAFELVILDEIDAYPYHGDPMLRFAADKCCRIGAPCILLSATPPRELQQAATKGKLAHARVPVRYHRQPLPVPKLLVSSTIRAMLEKGRLPATLRKHLKDSYNRGAQLFVFVQKIAHTEPLADLISTSLGCGGVAATSSQDTERARKVSQFRAGNIRILVTTTILERGVTIPRSDVFVLDADGGLFDEASLVQMAGRAGRSASDPHGKVYFIGRERNRSQLRAVRHIRLMNRAARKKGYLLSTPHSIGEKL
ncbi:DEAD/DEAH box helicase [Paenibacillus sp. GCM10027627]|uniref:DEAD/DEAH box helicase n=1 Tax=unclassified Paenibacillus TaxID=185978 RepID=UPI00362E5DDB